MNEVLDQAAQKAQQDVEALKAAAEKQINEASQDKSNDSVPVNS